jgi:hypothetical protein
LEGISTYFQWKVRIVIVLRERKLWNFVTTIVSFPLSNPISLDLHEVKKSRAQRIILDGVKDHLIPHLVVKLISKSMWDSLTNLYDKKNEKRKISLRDKLHSTRMAKGESVASYLT